jgi:cyclophilin family peptidyl-prolyl cis-trans isomerase
MDRIKSPCMKILALLIALASPSRAELLAHFQTTQGTVTVVMQHEKTPQTVANFITLAQGTRDRLDVVTGAISRKPFYVAETFFRVVNTTSFKIAQTGSGNGTNTGGGPGYTFKDEFDATLLHVPYVLSMANSGPNTNGSQIFLTGNATASHLDFVHTVFGLVTDLASRSVVDAIHAAGDNGTTILDVTFSRTSPAAQAFDEFAQNLPFAIQSKGHLFVSKNVSATWNFGDTQSAGDIFRAFRSTTLENGSWVELSGARRHNGITPPGNETTISPVALDNASAPAAFYNVSIVKHPGSVSP